jgi:hypothetical protein
MHERPEPDALHHPADVQADCLMVRSSRSRQRRPRCKGFDDLNVAHVRH